MFEVLTNFSKSEKAVAVGLLVAGTTVLAAVGQISIAQWMEQTKWLAAIYVAGKTAQGVAAKVADGKEIKAENGRLKEALARSDATADAAVDAKFGAPEG